MAGLGLHSPYVSTCFRESRAGLDEWMWSYLTRQRSSQLIVEHKAPAQADRHNQEDKQEVHEQARVQSN